MQYDDAVLEKITEWISGLSDYLSQWGIAVVGLCNEPDCSLPVLMDDIGPGDSEEVRVYGNCPAGHELSGRRADVLAAIRLMYQ